MEESLARLTRSLSATWNGATSSELRELEERVDATLRELGVTFELPSGGHHNTWFCDLLPQVFTSDEWNQMVRGFEQRVRAFEMFLEDVYGPREILRQGIIPIPVVLGSQNYQRSAVGLRLSGGHFLHLSGLCICRDVSGRLLVKNHYLSHASGLSYMIQNRRLLARVLPELFQSQSVESIADIPTAILLKLRAIAPQPDPSVVLLTPGVRAPFTLNTVSWREGWEFPWWKVAIWWSWTMHSF